MYSVALSNRLGHEIKDGLTSEMCLLSVISFKKLFGLRAVDNDLLAQEPLLGCSTKKQIISLFEINYIQ